MSSVLLTLIACCPPFEDIEIDAEPDQTTEVRAAISAFASWTSRDGVCVERVVVENDGQVDVGGRLQGGTVSVDPDWGITDVVHHELCHAWDAAAGRPSHDHPDLFPPDGIEGTHYPTDADRTEEAFALACGAGPREWAYEEFIRTLCPTLPLDPTYNWLLANVFDTYDDPSDAVMRASPTISTVQTLRAADRSVTYPDLAPAGSALAALRLADGAYSVELFDLYDAVKLGEREVPDISVGPVGLLNSADDPLLWSSDGTALRLWELASDGPRLLATLEEENVRAVEGHAANGRAWIHLFAEGDILLDVDLLDGSVQPFLDMDASRVFGLRGSGDQAYFAYGAQAHVWSFSASDWVSVMELERWSPALVPLGDGRLAGLQGRSPLIVDPATAEWTFSEECTSVPEGAELIGLDGVVYAVSLPATPSYEPGEVMRIEF